MVAIKLGLSENGNAPSYYRRVSVEPKTTAIEFLKRQAVLLFHQKEGDARDINLDAFCVLLFYVDAEGDKILLCNEADLTEAIKEGEVTLRAAIKVHATVRLVPATKSTQTFAATTSVEKGTQLPPVPVVDALCDLVHSVAVTAQAGVEAAALAAQEAHGEQKARLQEEAQKNIKLSKISLKRAKHTTKEQLKVARRQVKDSAKAVKASASTSKEALKNTIRDQKNLVKKAVKDQTKIASAAAVALEAAARAPLVGAPARNAEIKRNVVQEDVSKSNPAPEEQTPPFIHGRHTCDLCLNSPIIGKRFHATNLPDYDICGSCHENYQGTDITFVEAELDRDRLVQERWARKYHRMLQISRGRRNCHGRRGHRGPPAPGHPGPPHFGHGPFGCRFGPPQGPPPHHPHGPPPPHHHHRHGPPPPPHVPYVNPAPDSTGNTAWDAALEEAVRRSLEDATTSETASKSTESSEELVQEDEVAQEKEVVLDPEEEVAEEFQVDEQEAQEKTEPSLVEKDEPQDPPALEPAEMETKVEDLVKIAEMETNQELLKAVEDENPIYPTSVDHSHTSPPCQGPSKAKSDEMENSILSECSEGLVVSITDDSPVADETPSKESFSSDALESGSVAEFVGETLDKFSAAIDSLNSEMAGATIVDGESNGHDDDDESSKDSWSVVEDEQIAHDESLARAAVMIGSALFNSDNNIASSAGSHISSITSAPTEVPTAKTIPQALAERWSMQLGKLHELGFNDDAASVEVMELLAAANIGSGEEEEISVTQVVNHLM